MIRAVVEPGIPRKVRRKAHEFGVHADCIASGSPCSLCSVRINQAFDFFYGHCENSHEMLVAIMDDFARDIEEEQ